MGTTRDLVEKGVDSVAAAFFNFRPGETETDSRPDTGGASSAPGKVCHHSTKGGVCHQIPDTGVQAMLLETFAIRVEIHSTKGEPASPAKYQLRSDSGKSHHGSDIRNGT